jgi:hypothetical protein
MEISLCRLYGIQRSSQLEFSSSAHPRFHRAQKEEGASLAGCCNYFSFSAPPATKDIMIMKLISSLLVCAEHHHRTLAAELILPATDVTNYESSPSPSACKEKRTMKEVRMFQRMISLK